MKRFHLNLLSFLIISFVVMSCGDSPSEAYVRQICHEQSIEDSDIKGISSTPSDSLMTSVTTSSTAILYLTKSVSELYSGKIKADSCEKVFTECNNLMDGVSNSWEFGGVLKELNDSLKSLYPYDFRKVEEVTVEFKSGETKTIRVLFDDTNKPVRTEKQVEKDLKEYQEKMLELYERFLDY